MAAAIEFQTLTWNVRPARATLVVAASGAMNLSGDLLRPDLNLELPPSVDWQRRGPKVAQGDLWIGDEAIHIDFWSCKPNERGSYLCFAAGPMELNLVMRQRAIRMGYALSQIGLPDRETKRQLDDGTEHDIFRWLGMDYMTPEQREKWTKPKPSHTEALPKTGTTDEERTDGTHWSTEGGDG
jgi:hypothetical protein